MQQSQVINFYKVSELYGEFSNFWVAPIVIDGIEYKTSEHYFQAMKFHEHPEHVSAIRNAETPQLAADMGRERTRPLRKDWESVKDDIMYTALRAKFTQHPELKQLLMSTRGCHLVEHTKNDRYWGDGGDSTGKNMLGLLLVKLRDELK
jgi:N-glycosidase YbiA